jgi:ABC-type glycerol-3-phosphate transport system permease component
MSPHQLVVCLIAVAIDFVGMLVLYSAASHFLARLAWGRGGMLPLILLIAVTQLFWIPLALLTPTENEFVGRASYSAWFANWLVTAFAVVLLQQKTRTISKSLEETARLDGLGAMGTWRRVVLPLVSRELVFLAILLMMALLMACWHFSFFPNDMTTLVVVLHGTETLAQHFGLRTAASLFGAIPLIMILLLAKRPD